MAPTCESTRPRCSRWALISMFISGGVSGFFLARPSLDIMLHATYFVVGHFHLVMAVAAMFGIFSGTYFWFPRMTGRMMNETLGKLPFLADFVGAYCIFMPFHYLGMAGNVRFYQAFTDDYLIPLIPVHGGITVVALLTGLAQLIFIYNLIYSRFKGPLAPNDNPWEGTSHTSGARLRRRRTTILATRCRWFITILISTASRVPARITSCKPHRRNL